jgi:hypothetical protein
VRSDASGDVAAHREASAAVGRATRLGATWVSSLRTVRMRVRMRTDGATSACEVSSIDGASDVCCGVAAARVPKSVGMSTVANGAVNGSVVRINSRPASVFRSMRVSRRRSSKTGASLQSQEEP